MNKNSKIEVWSQPNCAGCKQVKSFLESKGFGYVEYILGVNADKKTLFDKVPSVRSVPQVFIDDVHIGGAPETIKYISDSL